MNTTLPAGNRPTVEQVEHAERARWLGYPVRGWHFSPFAPAIWVAIVWLAMVMMLYAVGYLDPDGDTSGRLAKLMARLKDPEVDFAARRAARAFSGVTLAITFVLSFTGLVWAGSAFMKKANHFRLPALGLMVAFLATCLLLSWWVAEKRLPFTSEIGQQLLSPMSSGAPQEAAAGVPTAMFVLACVVPCVLLAGATFLLQPMDRPSAIVKVPAMTAVIRADQLKMLIDRVRELDQMLYIGAITLVFGTLQLSAGLSVPLVSMPKAATVKAQAELCKLMSPAAAANAFFTAASAASKEGKAVDEMCHEIPKQFIQVESADSLRQLARGITLCFGLAFSALLAAVYVPALVGLRLMIDERVPDTAGKPAEETNKAIAEIEPLHRVAAVVATLSPLFAGLIANSLAIG